MIFQSFSPTSMWKCWNLMLQNTPHPPQKSQCTTSLTPRFVDQNVKYVIYGYLAIWICCQTFYVVGVLCNPFLRPLLENCSPTTLANSGNYLLQLIMLVLPVTTYMIIIKNIFLVSSEYTVDLRHIKFLYNLVKSIFWDRLSLNFILDIYLLLPHS